MLGWIQAAMQQNTNVSYVHDKEKLCNLCSIIKPEFEKKNVSSENIF